MAKKITRPMIIGGVVGLGIHFIRDHQMNFQTFLSFGAHNIDGIAFALAGAFVGWFLTK